MTAGSDEIKVEVVGVFEQEMAFGGGERRITVVLLRDEAAREARVPIASCEAFGIQLALEQHVVPRPLTHDLALRLLERLSARLDHVVVDSASPEDLRATIYLETSQGEMTLYARPGDAVALALRADVPIYATDDILADENQLPG